MKKLSLNLDALTVESFETSRDGDARGTVVGNRAVSDTTCFQEICDCPSGSGWTCEPSQNGTCEATCDFTCPVDCFYCPVTEAPEFC
ncbi:MAG TPA: pinensin family lanthipeptide [Longimicrobium sp.]|jgi:hypothetical protein|uniref:pinensin family lanthipeptide n=1 Tax=Longimicrobium sp. TaxID=2029185 RepID=UPI002ED781FD